MDWQLVMILNIRSNCFCLYLQYVYLLRIWQASQYYYEFYLRGVVSRILKVVPQEFILFVPYESGVLRGRVNLLGDHPGKPNLIIWTLKSREIKDTGISCAIDGSKMEGPCDEKCGWSLEIESSLGWQPVRACVHPIVRMHLGAKFLSRASR